MASLRRVVSGVFGNWAAMATSLLVGFFLAPFLVSRLGSEEYGVWVIVGSLASYMGLLDFGLRSAVTRFVARDFVRGDHEDSARVVSTALASRMIFGLLALVIAGNAAWLAPRLMHLPTATVSAARIAIALLGINVAVSLSLGVFGGVLTALHRFDLVAGVTIGQSIVRAVSAVLVVLGGFGIVGLATTELTTGVLAGCAQLLLCRKEYRHLRISFRLVDREILRQFWNYSSWIVVIQVGQQMIYFTDNLVVGAVLSATAVTFYAIGGSLTNYVRGIVSALTSTFSPLASSLEAAGDRHGLRQLLIEGTRMTFVIGLPIQIALFLRGHTFIRVWMGPRYALTSGTVVMVLLTALFARNASHTAGGVMIGIAKHRIGAIWTIAEGIANFALSVFLARRIGVVGVAWGTAIPSLFFSLFLRPQYVCRLVDLPLRTFVWQSCLRPTLAALPYAAACYACERWWTVEHMSSFLLQIAVALPMYATGVALVFRREIQSTVLPRLRRRFLAASAVQN